MRYRYYFFDSQVRISGCEEHLSDSDALAIEHARKIRDARGGHDSFEVWDGTRLIHSEIGTKTYEKKDPPTRSKDPRTRS